MKPVELLQKLNRRRRRRKLVATFAQLTPENRHQALITIRSWTTRPRRWWRLQDRQPETINVIGGI